jgi:hypothetical protein
MNTNIGKNGNTLANEIVRSILLIAFGITFALTLMFLRPQPAHAGNVTIIPPDVPAIIQVPAGNQPFRVAHAVGTQNYVCLSTGWATRAYSPQATLFDEENEQILTHFLSPYPAGSNSFSPTWQDSRDTSTVWANPVDGASYTPDPTAIPWLLLKVVGTVAGPTNGDKMIVTTFVQRVNTTGGLKPTGTCKEGDKSLVSYTADYYFYKAAHQ